MGPDCIKRLTAEFSFTLSCKIIFKVFILFFFVKDSEDLNQTSEYIEGAKQLKEADVIIHSN